MPRLVVQPASGAAWELELKPGINSLGRNATNDFSIPDTSVSGSHCEIELNDNSVILKDLASTNGTFVDGKRIAQTELANGQTIRLGGVEIRYLSDGAGSPLRIESASAATEFNSSPQPAEAPRTARVSLPPATSATLATSVPTPHPLIEPGNCRFHPKTLGRFFCPKCQHYFCELCVTSRLVNGTQHKYCRHCGEECCALQVRLQAKVEKGFYPRVPGAFLYPMRGAGALIVLAGIVILTLLKVGRSMMQLGSLRALAFGAMLDIFAGGYLFTYLQGIIHSTVAQERELPDLPWINNFADDILVPFFRLFGLFICCFLPAVAVGIWAGVSGENTGALAFLLAVGFAAIYFPMAFLATAILDSIAAANPLVVVPSILKAPGEYLLCLIPLACSSAVQSIGALLMKTLFPDGWMTHSMALLLAMVAVMAVMSFLSFYLIILSVHLLGLLYLTKKAKLGWLAR